MKHRVRGIIAYILIIAILFGIIPQEAYVKAQETKDTLGAEYISQGCRIEYKTLSSWGDYANVDISITNESETKINLWEVEFSYSSQIQNIWNADIVSDQEGDYRIRSKTYNSVIEKGQSVSFGFTAYCEGSQPEAPENIALTDEQSRKDAEQTEGKEEDPDEEKDDMLSIFPEKWKGLNYALFTSGDKDLSLYTCKTNISGNVHTNKNFYYQGTELLVQGMLEAAELINLRTSSMADACKVADKKEQADCIEMPDITEEVRAHVQENGESYGDGKSFDSDKVSLKKSIYVNGNVVFNATSFSGQGIVYAGDSITYNVGQLTTHENSRIFMASEKGDITLNGSDINMDAVLYAPNGCVRINANNFNLNGRIIARQVCINGTTININAGNGDFDMLPFLQKSGMDFELKVSGNQKENRKVVIDVEELENTGYLQKGNAKWSITQEGKDAEGKVRIDETASDEFHREMLFTAAGTYVVSVTVTTERADCTLEKEIVVEEDMAPVAAFDLETDYVRRGETGEGKVLITDNSCSPDGDEIGNRYWYIYYDKNNDGVFSEEEKSLLSDGNQKEITYCTKQVGMYQVTLEVKETFEDTIEHLLDDSAYLRGDTLGMPSEECIFEVGNEAPSAELDMEKSKSADIVFTVGEADSDKLETYRKKAKELQQTLEEKGIDARIDVEESSVLTAKDRFAWKEFDHYNYKDFHIPMIDKHIVYGEEDIRMLGYGRNSVKDFLYVPDEHAGKKTFEFDLQKDSTNWHSMEGGGFLFNTTVSEEDNTIQGFCILVTKSGLKLVQIDCNNLTGFRDGKYNYVQNAGKLLRSFTIKNVGEEHHFRVEVYKNMVSVWDGEELVIDQFVLPENDYGFGYGPITSHSYHNCTQRSYFTFRNILMQTENGKSLSDIVSGYDWRPGAAHYVLNLSQTEVPELADDETAAELAAVLVENEAAFAGIGNEKNENQYKLLLNAAGTGGMFREAEDMDTAMEDIVAYLSGSILAKDYSILDYVTTDDIVTYKDFYRDMENDPMYDAEWIYEYDPSVFGGKSGETEHITRKEKDPITVFENPGAYAIWLKVRDNPAADNDALDDYRKWSEQAEANKLLLVHQRPETTVEVKVAEDSSDPSKCIVKADYHAEDADHPEDSRKGIREEKYYYKKVQDTEWTEGKIPNKVEMGQTYLIKYIVKDVEGACSFPAAAVVRTSDCISYKEVTDENPPTVHIQAEKLEMAPGETILIQGYAEDDYGVDDFNLYINDEKMLSSFGQVRYTAGEEGIVTIHATARDIGGNEAQETLQIEVVDRRDRTAPVADITSPKSGSDIGTNVQIKGTAKDETAFKKYTLSYRAKDDENATIFATGTEEVEEDVLGTLDISEFRQGVYEILLTVEDQAGNKSYCGLCLNIETKEVTEEYTYRICAAISGIVYDEETKKIDIYGKADAEGHFGSYELSYQPEESVESKMVSKGQEEVKDGLLGSIDVGNLSAGDYEVLLMVSDSRGNQVKATASFEYIIEEKETTITITQVINPEPAMPEPETAPVETLPSLTPEVTASPEPTRAAEESPAPTATPDVTGLPDIGQEELDEILKRTFGLTLSQDIAYTGTEVTAYVTLPFTVKEDSVVIMLDGKVIAEKAKSVSFTRGKAGTVTITAKGINHLGEEVSDTKQCTFYDSNDKNPPVAAFDLPKGEAVLTEPVDITGSAYDKEKLDYYTLEYRLEGTNEFALLKKSTEPKKNEVLGHLDTTMLPNGRYEVRLSVVDKGGNRNRIIRKYVVEGNLKVGAMNLGFTDITTSMGGTKVNVNRSYSSANKTKGDFGMGWSLGVQGMTLSETNPLHTGYKLSVTGSWFAPGYSLNETKSHDIVVAYGDGTSDRFELTMTPDRQSLLPIHEVELGYRCVTDPKVKLEIDGDNIATIQDTEFLLSDTTMYNNVKYKLTTAEGVTIYLSAKYGVTKLEDTYGNIIKVDKNGYHSTDGRSITFTRDLEDRIICAEDPNGKKIRYTYDDDGNLSKVIDSADREVSFTYDRDHNLISITDPMGIAVARNEYGENGRLTAIVDSEGNRTEYDYDIGGRSQVVKDRLGNSTVYVYDDNGNVLQQTDANGNTTKNTYDESGNLLTKTDANGNTATFAYDESGNITSVTDAMGNCLANSYNDRNMVTSMKSEEDEILIDYDEDYNISETTDLAGNRTEYDYDQNGNVTGIADSIGEIASAKYDKDGNVIENTNSAGQKTTYTYDEAGNRLTQTEYVETEEGTKEQTTAYVYDEAGDLLQTVDPEGNITSIERDAAGKMICATDEQGRKTRYEYTSGGDVSQVYYADGTTESFTYDAEGRVLESVNRMGRKECYEYDKVGNLRKSTDARGNVTTYEYDKNYNVLSVTSPAGAKTEYTYDALNRNTSVTDADGNTTTFTYNKYSFLTEVKDAKGNVTKYEYNEAGNRTKTTYPDGTSVESGYDKRGRIIWQKDAAGTKTGYTYDSADRLTEVDSEASGTTHYAYDKNGNLSSVEDVNGNIVKYAYDEQGRLIKTTQPDGSTSTSAYDKYGRLQNRTDYNGVTTNVEYDGQDRLIREITGDFIKTYEYDTYGRLTKVSAGDSIIRYTYNKYGELTEKIYENGQKISYGYDTFGRKCKITVGQGDQALDETNYKYDKMDRITRVIGRDGMATVYTYDENGNRETATFANGVVVTYAYDTLNRLLVQKTVDSTGELIAQYKYTLGKNGERTKASEKSSTGTAETTYEYDGAGRLTGEQTVSVDADGKETTAGYAYKYDEAGNRISKTVKGDTTITTEYTYNSRNQLVSEKTNGQETIYTYDANGNLLNKSGAAGNESYEYDVYDRLVFCRSATAGKSESYQYDAEGVRRSKTALEEDEKKTVVFVSDTASDLSRILAETDAEGNLLTAYTWGDTLISQSRDEKTSTYLYDGHGDVRGLLDEKATLTDTYSYNAYGELIGKTGETENHYLYTGEYYDGMSGLYYLRARYMNPGTGTFISMDTYQGNMYEPVTLHKYLYANANPVKYTDPSGMFSLAEMNVTLAAHSIVQNQNQIYLLGLMTAVGNATFTAVCGGSAEEVMEAFGTGFLVGAGMGLFVCGVILINVIAIAEASAFIAVAALSTGLANLALLSVLTIYSVVTGNDQELMTYTSLLMIAFMGFCDLYGIYGEMTVTGDKGSKTISYSEYEEICKKSVKNPGKDKVMLGKYDGGGPTSYVTKAGKDYEYFSLGNEWDRVAEQYGLSEKEMFKLFNEPFLDDGINAGKTFYFSHNPKGDQGSLGMEFKYLEKNGYGWKNKPFSMQPKR